MRSGRIRSNPAHGLGLPRPRRRDYVFLTQGQLRALADDAGSWRVFVVVLGYTGLRWGEATALRVCDIDLARRRVDIRRAFSDVGGHVVLGTPKSHQSRTVSVPRFLARELSAATAGKHTDDLVFTMPGGMDRYADRLDSAAETTDPARIRPDDEDDEPDAGDAAL